MSENTPQTNSLYAKIEDLLKSIPELVTEEKELRYNKIKEMAESGDSILLIPLMQNAEIKNAFFTPILDSFVFKTKEFKEFLDYSSSNNSYSQYLGKKIGLYCGDSALTDRNEVVLNFPFKDCVLEGGQKKEDGLDTYFEYDEKTGEYVKKQSKRREVFFNETLAKDEIDNLFSPKAFCNVKKYTTDGESSCVDFTRDAEVNKKRGLSEDTITDNLIIKGNNLLALHSLKKEFEGKIKLIYIDPPYNTGSDGFSYNDNFNHSSWLTFMKNRLEVAKDLLRDDGCIFVQCDDREQAYLKVLLDDVFKRDNCINVIIPEMSNMSGQKINNAIKGSKFPKIKEFILLYSKNKSQFRVKVPKISKEKWDNEYNLIIDPFTEEDFLKFKEYEENHDFEKINLLLKNKEIKSLKSYIDVHNILEEEIENWRYENSYKILASKPNESLLKKAKQSFFEQILCVIPNVSGDIKLIRTDFNRNTETARIELVFASDKLTQYMGDIWFKIVTTGGVAQEGNVKLKNGKKPEQLLKLILESSSNPSDIILDYHLGSGTTAAVAHKMNRQYIGVEQLNYGENDSVVRLQNVINGDSTGISKSVNWQGGGSFVYMELAEKNEKAMQLISACKNYDELVSIFNTLSTKYFLHYNVRINDFINKTCKEEQFKNLSLEKQKEIFCRMLDLNQLYVNCDDRNDKDSGLSEKDIKATENFYQIQKDGE